MPTVLPESVAVSSLVIFSLFRLVRTSTKASSGSNLTNLPVHG